VKNLAEIETGDYRLVLYEVTAEGNSTLHELIIPVHVIKYGILTSSKIVDLSFFYK